MSRSKMIKINEMMLKYPDAEVICMVSEEACPYEYSRQLAGFGYTSHDWYLVSDEYGLDEDRIYFKSDDDEVEDAVGCWIAEEMPEVDFDKVMEIIETKWIECIVVNITSP